jgi:hypothetical protein
MAGGNVAMADAPANATFFMTVFLARNLKDNSPKNCRIACPIFPINSFAFWLYEYMRVG